MDFIQIKNLFLEFDDCFGNKKLSECTDLERYAEFFQDSIFSIVKKDGKRIGVLCFNIYENIDNTKTANLNFIVVKKEFQKKGLEPVMLEHAHELAKKHGACDIKVMVKRGINEERELYEDRGYKYLHPAGEDSVFIGKKLD